MTGVQTCALPILQQIAGKLGITDSPPSDSSTESSKHPRRKHRPRPTPERGKEKGKKQIEYIDRIVKGDTTEITKDMSEEERKAFLAKQKELEDSIKNCPVPKIVVEEINKAADPK